MKIWDARIWRKIGTQSLPVFIVIHLVFVADEAAIFITHLPLAGFDVNDALRENHERGYHEIVS